jgi:REP element-mobilizing transposase RayT
LANRRADNYARGVDESHIDEDWEEGFRMADARLDRASRGPFWLRDPELAGYAEDAVIRGAELRHYDLHAYVVMPNHMHILLEPHVPLARITRGLKGVSARDANATLGRVGRPFWQDESFDHWVRNEAEFERIHTYIESNPTLAGLVAKPEDWQWSSARRAKDQ